MPPTLVATTGTPHAMASTFTFPKGSCHREGQHKMSADLYSFAISLVEQKPAKVTFDGLDAIKFLM
jgi:hypothetical protein